MAAINTDQTVLKSGFIKHDFARRSANKLDAVSGATPSSGQQTYTWGCTDGDGNIVPDGEYRFYVEGTLYRASSVLYSGTVTVGGEGKENIQIAEKYTEDIKTNRNMITAVTAKYVID